MTAPIIRDATTADADAIVALNAAVVQWTSPMGRARLAELATVASYFRVATLDGVVAGFLLGMDQASAYRNDNFAWFNARYDTFLYIDRIVVGSAFGRRGVAQALYADAFHQARRAGATAAVCEYTWAPRNEVSARFHARMGFREVGHRTLGEGPKVVSMQHLSLAP